MRPRDDHAHGAAADEGDGLAIEAIGEEGGQLARRRLQRLRITERGLEELLGVIVVKAPVVNSPHVPQLAAEPQHLAQGHAFPQPLA